MKYERPPLAHCCAALLTLGMVLPAWARCIDEGNVEFRAAATTSGVSSDADGPRIVLRSMVRRALARSQAVGASKILAEASLSDVNESKAATWPQVLLSGSVGRTQSEVDGSETSNGALRRASLNVSAPVYDGGRLNQLIDWRKHLAQAAHFGQLSTQEQISYQTVALAIERSRYQLQAQVFQQYARRMSCLVDALETIVSADKGRTSELVQARKTLKQAEISQVQTASVVRQMETRLRRFLGDELPSSEGLTSVLLTLPPLSEVLAQVENANEIAQLGAYADAAGSYMRSVQALKKPQLGWALGSARTAGAGESSSWQAAINLTIPLFNATTGHAVASASKRAEAAKLQRAEALENRKFRITEIHEQGTSAFDRARRVADVLRDSERVRTFTLQQWQQLGRRSLFDVMGSESDHYGLRIAYVNALYDGEQSTALLWSLGLGISARLE